GALTASCSDRLFVGTTTNDSNNLWVFDRLYPTPPGSSTACTTPPADANCTASANGWCPHKLFSVSLSGNLDRSFLSFSADGSQLYAATSTGMLYAVDAASTGSVTWSFDARAEIALGGNNAGFVGSGPWVNYGDGSLYIAANYTVAGSS